MKYIYIAWKLFWKQKLTNLFLMITLILSVYYLAPACSQFLYYRSAAQELAHLDMENGYYLYRNPYYGGQDKQLLESIQRRGAQTGVIQGIASVYSLAEEKEQYEVLCYNDLLIRHYHPELIQGTWFEETDTGDPIPAVVSQETGYHCGDEFQITVDADEKKQITCSVIGILRKSQNIVKLSNAADEEYFTADALLGKAENTLILPETAVKRAGIAANAQTCSKGSILYTDQDIGYEQIKETFGYAGIVTGLDAGNRRFLDQSRLLVNAMGCYFVLYLAIAVICMLCSHIVLCVRMTRQYTVYYLNGMSHRDRICIEAVRMTIFMCLCTAAAYLFLYRTGILQNYFSDYHPIWIGMALIGYLVFVILPITVYFVYKEEKTNLAEQIGSLNIEV